MKRLALGFIVIGQRGTEAARVGDGQQLVGCSAVAVGEGAEGIDDGGESTVRVPENLGRDAAGGGADDLPLRVEIFPTDSVVGPGSVEAGQPT